MWFKEGRRNSNNSTSLLFQDFQIFQVDATKDAIHFHSHVFTSIFRDLISCYLYHCNEAKMLRFAPVTLPSTIFLSLPSKSGSYFGAGPVFAKVLSREEILKTILETCTWSIKFSVHTLNEKWSKLLLIRGGRNNEALQAVYIDTAVQFPFTVPFQCIQSVVRWFCNVAFIFFLFLALLKFAHAKVWKVDFIEINYSVSKYGGEEGEKIRLVPIKNQHIRGEHFVEKWAKGESF